MYENKHTSKNNKGFEDLVTVLIIIITKGFECVFFNFSYQGHEV